MPHLRRPAQSPREPAHVTLRVERSVPHLRSQRCMAVLRGAFRDGRERYGFRLVHYSVQGNHLHLVVEAEGRRSLSRGLQGLSIRIARRLNAELRRRGKVFADRYHARSLGSPTEVRNVLRYVLLNGRHHGQRPSAVAALDPCSSASCLDGWSRKAHAADPAMGGVPVGATVVAARTWLMCAGWRRLGPLDPDHIPRPRRGS